MIKFQRDGGGTLNTLKAARNIPIKHNVSIRVIDSISGRVVSEHTGHNAATNSLLTGIAHYLTGDGVLNQGYHMLSAYVPKYISLGTMGLLNQEEDENGLPSGVGEVDYSGKKYKDLSEADMKTLGHLKDEEVIEDGTVILRQVLVPPDFDLEQDVTEEDQECLRYIDYITQCPGYGADGYDENLNNNRKVLGLGPVYGSITLNDKNESVIVTNNCELISDSFPRAKISFRDIVPETESEFPKTLDVVFSAMVSTGALKQFRETLTDADGNQYTRPYVFITETGLWSRPDWVDGGDNGLLAGYRIGPTNKEYWDMHISDNREKLKRQIIKVGINQVVQVIWKIQIGGIDQFGGIEQLYPNEFNSGIRWVNWF